MPFIEDLLGSIEKRQAASQTQQAQQQEIAGQAAEARTTYRKAIQPVTEGILQRRAKQAHARQLVDSGGFMEMATLAGLRLLDPGGYDQEVRARRTQEDVGFISTLGAVTDVRMQELQSRLVESQTQLQGFQLSESIALERAEQATKVNELRRGELMSSRMLQDEQIAGMSPEEINEVLSNSGDTLNAGGVEIPRFKLQEEARRRELLELTELAQHAAHTDEQKRRVQRERLQLMPREELTELRVNNYQLNGEMFRPDDVDSAYTKRVQAEDDSINEALRAEQLRHLPQGIVTEAAQLTEVLKESLPADSPMQAHVRSFKTRVGAAAGLVESSDPNQQAAGLALIQSAQEEFQKQAAAQARRDSPLDKELEQARFEFYTSGRVPTERVTAIAIDRLAADKSLAGVLPARDEQTLRQIHRQVFESLISEAAQDMMAPAMTQTQRKEAKREAAVLAWGEFLSQHGGQIANRAYYQQTAMAGIPGTDAPPHPLHGIESPTKFAGTVRQAEEAAIEVLQQQYGLDRDQVHAILARGNAGIPEGSQLTAEEFVAQLNHLQSMHLMQMYDPEMAQRIIDWNLRWGDQYIDMFTSAMRGSTSGFEAHALLSLTSESARDEWYSTVGDMSVALDSAKQQTAQKIADFAFGDPELWQAAMLQSDQNLQDSEKEIVWEAIAPILAEAQQLGLRGPEAQNWIERRVGALEFDSPEGRKAYKTFMRERKLTLDTLRNAVDWIWNIRFHQMGVYLPNQESLLREQVGGASFYTKWKAQQ